MAANAFVRARIDEDLKNQAADVLAGMGLTISDLVRITLTKVAREKALPFDLREPNQLTIQSIKNSEAGIDVHKAVAHLKIHNPALIPPSPNLSRTTR